MVLNKFHTLTTRKAVANTTQVNLCDVPSIVKNNDISSNSVTLWASVFASVFNGVAGGGSFISFPALLFAGVPPINANATNNAVMFVGLLGSASAYKSELLTQRPELLTLSVVSLIGGTLGSLLLLHTTQTLFTFLIPYLLLIATLVFTFSKPLTKWLYFHGRSVSNKSGFAKTGLLLQLAVATYGGFFGGGVGILILAMLAVMGMQNFHTMNALKTLLNLTTALCLKEKGFEVTVVAENFAPQVTSVVAGALWEWPPAVCGYHPDERSLERSKEWCITSYDIFSKLSEKQDTGVFMRDAVFYFEKPVEECPRSLGKCKN